MAKNLRAFKGTPFQRAFAAGVRGNVPTIVWGPPGVGKSATIEGLRSLNWYVETLICSIRDASDFLGLPVENNGGVDYVPPSWAKRAISAVENGHDLSIINFDELTTCEPAQFNAALRVFQERVVGEVALPDHVRLVAAANPPEVAANGQDLPPALANRMLHLDWKFDADSWFDNIDTNFSMVSPADIDGMLGVGGDVGYSYAAAMVKNFTKARPDLLNPGVPEDMDEQGKAWPSPRSWHNAVKVLAELHPDDEQAQVLVLRGTVGKAAADEMIAWLATADLYDAAEVLDNPSIVEWESRRPDQLFAVVSSVTALARMRGDADSWKKALMVMVACAKHARPDVALPSVRMLVNDKPEGAKMPAAVPDAFSDIMVATGREKAAKAS